MQSQGLHKNITSLATKRYRNNLIVINFLAKYKKLRYTMALAKSLKIRIHRHSRECYAYATIPFAITL